MIIVEYKNYDYGFIHRRRRFEGHPLRVRHKQDWGRGFIFLLPQDAVMPGSDPGSGVKPVMSIVIQSRQTSCSMWCLMCGALYQDEVYSLFRGATIAI